VSTKTALIENVRRSRGAHLRVVRFNFTPDITCALNSTVVSVLLKLTVTMKERNDNKNKTKHATSSRIVENVVRKCNMIRSCKIQAEVSARK
jgi:hypothetical protein